MKKRKEQKISLEGGAAETPVPKKRRKRKKAPIIIAVVIVLLIVVRFVACGGNDQAAALVVTSQALRGDLQETVNTSGTVSSEEKKVIFAPVSGTLKQVNIAAGDAVKAGEVLISYDAEKLEQSLLESRLQLQKSNANYNGANETNTTNQWKLEEANHNLGILEQQISGTKEQIKKWQNELDESQRNTNSALAKESMELNRKLSELTKELEAIADRTSQSYADKAKEVQDVNNAIAYNSYVSSIASTSDYVAEMQQKIADAQETLSGYETYKAEMEAQKSAAENAVMSSYDKQQQNADKELAAIAYQSTEEDYELAKNGITADFDGIVTECSAVPGAGVNGGMQLLTLESSNNLKVTFFASKSEIEKLELGQKAEVVVSGNTYPGTISKINRMAEQSASGTPMVGVEIHLLEVDDSIILGMDAKATIYTRSSENTLLIPVEAINADREGDFLYVVENGIVVKKPILCGLSTDIYTEVLEGISEEDAIILSAYSNLEEGMAVTALPAQ